MPTPGKHYTSFLLALTHPYARGSVHITSSDPLALPALDPRLYEHDIDLDMLVEGLKFARKVMDTDALKSAVKEEIIPGPAVKTDDELKEFVRSTGQTVYHPVGTASMLPRKDGGVVSPELKVYGTKNVRVVSALPNLSRKLLNAVCLFEDRRFSHSPSHFGPSQCYDLCYC